MTSMRFGAILALLAFLAGLVFATFSEMRIFLPALLRGAGVTVQVALASAIVFYVSAILAGVGRISLYAPVRWISSVYIEVFRGTSLLVQLFWLFFVLPEFGLTLSPFVAGVMGIGLNFGAYGAEVVRGGILAVPKGQVEASIALNMPRHMRMTRIIFPQAFAIMVPGLGNLTIEMIKATSVVSAVTLVDITYASVLQNNIHYRTIEIFAVTLLLYYCFSQLTRFGVAIVEQWSARYRPARM